MHECSAHLDLGHFRGGGAAGSCAHLQGQVSHPAGLLYELVEAAQPAQLHHNGQGHTTHVRLYSLQGACASQPVPYE